MSQRGRAMSNSLKTISTFAEHTAEMLESVADRAELLKRHRPSLERLRASLDKLLEDGREH